MRRLLPDPGPTSVAAQLAGYDPGPAPPGRPFVAMNFAVTVDGRATIDGVSGPIGSANDTAMLSGLRGRFDAVMIGAGTMRAERYANLAQPLVVVESGPEGRADLRRLLRSLREEQGVEALLCEGGPRLHGSLQRLGLVDEVFLTYAPKLAGGEAPRLLEGELDEPLALDLVWLLEEDGELFARYRMG